MFPSNSSVTRRLASLCRIARGSLLRLLRYHQGAPTSHRPSRQTRFRSSGDTTHHCGTRGSGELLFPAPLRNCAGASILFLRPRSWRAAGSPRFLGSPFTNMLCSSTPADLPCPATHDTGGVAFPTVDSVGSASRHLSRLNHTACSLAVYASQLGLLRSTPRKTRFPLTATLRGTGFEPAGLHPKVSLGNVSSHYFDPPSPSFAWRSNRRDAAEYRELDARGRAARTARAATSMCRVGVMRSCALVYRGRWAGVKGRAHNCAWGRHALLVAARKIAMDPAAGG